MLVAFGAEPASQQVDHLPERYCPKKDMDDIVEALNGLSVIYFRPYGWLPALRMELPSTIIASNTRLSIVLEGVTRQFFSPAVIEPYPLFLADRMVKEDEYVGLEDRMKYVLDKLADAGIDTERVRNRLEENRLIKDKIEAIIGKTIDSLMK